MSNFLNENYIHIYTQQYSKKKKKKKKQVKFNVAQP